ncbi:MAG: response regulator [Candidatus Eisenbacteria bacterium]
MARILIVDDDRLTRELVSRMLRKRGHETIKASDGEVAFGILEANEDIQLVITDVVMPRMDGARLVQLIRGQQVHRALPILIVSSVATVGSVAHLLDLGASRFLPKPIAEEELSDSVTEMLRAS